MRTFNAALLHSAAVLVFTSFAQPALSAQAKGQGQGVYYPITACTLQNGDNVSFSWNPTTNCCGESLQIPGQPANWFPCLNISPNTETQCETVAEDTCQ